MRRTLAIVVVGLVLAVGLGVGVAALGGDTTPISTSGSGGDLAQSDAAAVVNSPAVDSIPADQFLSQSTAGSSPDEVVLEETTLYNQAPDHDDAVEIQFIFEVVVEDEFGGANSDSITVEVEEAATPEQLTPTPAPDDQPGFGIVIAVLAIVIAAMGLRKRR